LTAHHSLLCYIIIVMDFYITHTCILVRYRINFSQILVRFFCCLLSQTSESSSVSDPDSIESGVRILIQQGKRPTKNEEIFFLCAQCSLLRAGGFSCPLKVLEINILQFFVTRNRSLGQDSDSDSP
jgi:hypothetical protein